MINLTNSEKVNVLLSALNERYKATHEIRNRVFNTCTWVMGIFIAITGWIIQAKIILNTAQKLFILSILLLIFIIIRFFYLHDLEKGFKNQFRIASRLEEILGFYQKDAFIKSDKPLFPESWKQSGNDKCDGKYFRSSYMLLYFAVLALSSAIIFIDKISK